MCRGCSNPVRTNCATAVFSLAGQTSAYTGHDAMFAKGQYLEAGVFYMLSSVSFGISPEVSVGIILVPSMMTYYKHGKYKKGSLCFFDLAVL